MSLENADVLSGPPGVPRVYSGLRLPTGGLPLSTGESHEPRGPCRSGRFLSGSVRRCPPCALGPSEPAQLTALVKCARLAQAHARRHHLQASPHNSAGGSFSAWRGPACLPTGAPHLRSPAGNALPRRMRFPSLSPAGEWPAALGPLGFVARLSRHKVNTVTAGRPTSALALGSAHGPGLSPTRREPRVSPARG